MEPFSTAAIAAALGAGLWQVAQSLAQKAIIEPSLQPATEMIKKPLTRGYEAAKQDKALLTAVHKAFAAIDAPQDDDALRRYARNLGFDQMQAESNAELREEIARAALLVNSPDPQLVPETLYNDLRWPHDNRPLLARFLFALRQELENNDTWGPLVKQANEGDVRAYLQRATMSLDTIERYLAELLAHYGLAPDMGDAEALQKYVTYVAGAYRDLSFLVIKPSGQRGALKTQAELEAVFVPLQVEDPRERRQTQPRDGEPGVDQEKLKPTTIDEVLAEHPVFLLRGRPGSGKTTLLRHLATSFANGEATSRLQWQGEPLLPILVPLRNFGRFLEGRRSEYPNPGPRALREFIEGYFRDYDLKLPGDFFRRRLEAGRCLVMLDGLDEVAHTSLRAKVARVVDSFVKHYAPAGNRFVLASRPKGYDEVATYLSRPVVCNVQPLTPESRDLLVYNLLRQFTDKEKLCREETEELLYDIRNKERVDELSRNPLFCTTLVLVYKYRGTTLPERRVDVYQELVNLMLGFWETHREGVADVRELALMDGTGRAFMDENEAVEAKERALIDLADWMQQQGKAEVGKTLTLQHVAAYFAEREGADEEEKDVWAKGFLNVAHQRSGLFIEVDPDTYAFSHQNFREYLAATALVNRTDMDMVAEVLAHAADAWWEEVILLAAAHAGLSSPRRELLLGKMLEAEHVVLTGRCAVDAGARLPAPKRREVREQLYARMVDAALAPGERFAAGEVLDALGWLPPDLNRWVRCPACADDKRDLLVMQYPVTNAQFELFVQAGGHEPSFWRNVRFGKERRGFPVVGVAWYEAAAYAAWLADLLQQERAQLSEAERALTADLRAAGAREIRLLSEDEWVRVAGKATNDRYPWDGPQAPATSDKQAILQRANTNESGIKQTTPVAMYPLGAGKPFGLFDLAGNVWEWTNSWYDADQDGRALRGGSWCLNLRSARVAGRYRLNPDYSYDNVGFRLASPVGSGS